MRSGEQASTVVGDNLASPPSFFGSTCYAVCGWWQRRDRRLRLTLVLITLVGGLTAFLLPVSLGRLIDGDEGYLLMAARLVSEGNIPYRDFFLPQGPFLPAFFGTCFLVMGRGWLGARIVAGTLVVIMGLLVYQETRSSTRRAIAAVFATTLFTLSAFTIGWLTIVKGFGLSALWTLCSIHLLRIAARNPKNHPQARYGNLTAIAAGITVGFAASARLYVILVMPILALYLLRGLGFTRLSARRLGLYALGCLGGLLPLIVSYAIDRKAFLFNTLLFHGVREYGQSSLFGKMGEKLPVILEALGLHRKATIESRQLLGLVILAILAMFARLSSRNQCRSAAACVWPILLLGSVLPNPFLPQYLCLLVPFLAIEAGLFLAVLLDFLARRKIYTLGVAVCTLAYLAYYAGMGWKERHRYLYTGIDVPGVWSTDRVPRWRIATVEAAAKAIDAQGIPEAASWWPGYFISTKTQIIRSLANDFGFRAAAALSPADRRRFHVVSHEEVGDMIRRRYPRLFVEGSWASQPWASWLPKNGYQVRSTIHNVRIWSVP